VLAAAPPPLVSESHKVTTPSTPHPAHQHFFFSPPPAFYRPLDDLQAQVAPLLVTPATVFRHNLRSVIETARLPYQLVSAGVYFRRLGNIQMAERIRSGLVPGDAEKERILDIANTRFREMSKESSFREGARAETEEVLVAIRDILSDEVSLAARELLRQAASLTWAALEILFRDVFVGVLNMRPDLVKSLRAADSAKNYLPLKAVPFEAFETYGFDLSKRMGDLLAEERRMDSVVAMKAVLGPLLSDDALDGALDQKELRLLNQRRHLVVHRRGIVDSEYLANTDDTLPLGSELEISPENLRTYLVLVRDIGTRMLHVSTQRMAERL
jgi:hypothetical protein